MGVQEHHFQSLRDIVDFSLGITISTHEDRITNPLKKDYQPPLREGEKKLF